MKSRRPPERGLTCGQGVAAGTPRRARRRAQGRHAGAAQRAGACGLCTTHTVREAWAACGCRAAEGAARAQAPHARAPRHRSRQVHTTAPPKRVVGRVRWAARGRCMLGLAGSRRARGVVGARRAPASRRHMHRSLLLCRRRSEAASGRWGKVRPGRGPLGHPASSSKRGGARQQKPKPLRASTAGRGLARAGRCKRCRRRGGSHVVARMAARQRKGGSRVLGGERRRVPVQGARRPGMGAAAFWLSWE
ncbi:MAG: hypothetical protein J3K34DRAFT_428064 [Monoraphidium minutum]|nr:MAG: hypothetical protein J3K34DRAFT_428064 [Monoraphidium minutum]